jgi:hypothetical protein
VDQSVARLLPKNSIGQTENKRTQTSILRVGLEPTAPAFERAKTVHVLDRAATENPHLYSPIIFSTYEVNLERIIMIAMLYAIFLDNFCIQFHRSFCNSRERIWIEHSKLEHILYLSFIKGQLAFWRVRMERTRQISC